jgi:hypothetical protein
MAWFFFPAADKTTLHCVWPNREAPDQPRPFPDWEEKFGTPNG